MMQKQFATLKRIDFSFIDYYESMKEIMKHPKGSILLFYFNFYQIKTLKK